MAPKTKDNSSSSSKKSKRAISEEDDDEDYRRRRDRNNQVRVRPSVLDNFFYSQRLIVLLVRWPGGEAIQSKE